MSPRLAGSRSKVLAAGLGAAAFTLGRRLARRRRRIDLAGRSIVLMGASRGLGLALARQLAAAGAELTLTARDADELDRAKRILLEESPRARVMVIPCDVSRRDRVEWAIEQVIQVRGRIHALINLAGVIQVAPLAHMHAGDFERAMAVHFWGALFAMEAVLPHMRAMGLGRIVNITSIGGRIAVPHLAPYVASKFALAGLSDAMRAELDRDGIRVTTVVPGLMRTGSVYGAQIKGRHEAELAWFSIADSLPLLSMPVERAAAEIIDALRHGDRHLTIGVPAKLGILAQAVAPALLGDLMVLANRLLPAPQRVGGNDLRSGWQARSRAAPSRLTALTDRAAVEQNQLGDHRPEELVGRRRAPARRPRPDLRAP